MSRLKFRSLFPTGSLNISGSVTASFFVGDGSGLTNLPLSDVSALNAFTSSANSRLDDIEAATSSYLQAADLSELNLFTGSASTRLDSLEAATSSYATITELNSSSSILQSNLDVVSSSLAAETAQLLNFSASLDSTFATDTELNTVSASVKTFATDADTALSASLAIDIAANKADITNVSSSLALRVTNQEAFSSSLDSIFATDTELNTVSASVKTFATDADTALSASLAVDIATNAAGITSNSGNIVDNTGRIGSLESITGSLLTTASISDATITFSKQDGTTFDITVDNVASSTTAETASFANSFTVAGNLTVGGRVTAEEYHTEIVSASIIFQSGSTKFGDTLDDTHQFTGSLNITGSVTALSLSGDGAGITGILTSGVAGLNTFTSSVNSRLDSIEAATSSYLQSSDLSDLNTFTASADSRLDSIEAATSSYVTNSQTGSFLIGSDTGSLLITGSVLNNVITLEKADGSSFTLTVSTGSATIAATASYFTGSWIDFTPLSNGDAPAYSDGRLYYDSQDGALTFYNEEADIGLQIGQEFYIRVYNDTPSSITNGTPVRISGSQGDRVKVVPAVAEDHVSDSYEQENHIIGLATHTIETNSEGYVTTQGIVRGINTTAFSPGDVIYLQTGSAGFRNTPPGYPYETIRVGYVAKSHSNGFIYVDPKTPVHLRDLANVSGSAFNAEVGDLLIKKSNGGFTYSKILSGSYNINNGDLTVGGNIDSNDITINDWGSISASLATFSSGVTAGDGLSGGGFSGSVTLALDTGSVHFINGVLSSGLFRITGSTYSTTNDVEITGSLEINFTESDQEFRVSSQSITQFKINNEGVAVFATHSVAPTFVSGGIYYGSDGQFYFGTGD